MRYLISGDYHLGHGRICEYANRPFKSPDEMNNTIIKNHNSRVKVDDIFIHNGDFCFKSGIGCNKADYWINQLNGQKIFIKGNHDNNNSLKTNIECLYLSFANQRIKIVHKPEHSDASADINLIAHVHQNWKIRSFKQHYDILEGLIRDNKELEKDRPDISYFLCHNAYQRNSKSILLNVGVDVQKYMPVTLDEAIGQCIKFRKGIQ